VSSGVSGRFSGLVEKSSGWFVLVRLKSARNFMAATRLGPVTALKWHGFKNHPMNRAL
jgi:hypothetical protein